MVARDYTQGTDEEKQRGGSPMNIRTILVVTVTMAVRESWGVRCLMQVCGASID